MIAGQQPIVDPCQGMGNARREAALLAAAIVASLAIARLPLVPLLALIGGTVIVLATLIEPMAGLMITLVAAPLAAYTNFMTGAVLRPLDIGQVMFGLMLGACLLRGLARREIRLPIVPLFWPLALFVGWAALSLLWATSYEYALPEVIKWIEIILIVWMAAEAGRERLGWVLAGVLASGAFQGALGIWQHSLRGIGPETFKITEHLYRAYGSFEQPNPYAGYLGLIWPVAAGLLLGQFSTLHPPLSTFKNIWWSGALLLSLATCAVLPVAAIVFSWSRGAWLGALAAMAVMAAALPRRTWLGAGGAMLVMVMLLSANAIGVLPNVIRSRLTDFTQQIQVMDVRGVGINDANFAVLERLAHWQAAGEMIRYQPWTGVGFSNYEPVYPQYALMNWPNALGHAHNYYLNVTAELGIVGLLAYLLLWGAILWQTARVLRQGSGWRRGLAIGLLGAWTHLSAHHLFDNLYVNNTHLLVGALLGVLTVIDLDKGEDA